MQDRLMELSRRLSPPAMVRLEQDTRARIAEKRLSRLANGQEYVDLILADLSKNVLALPAPKAKKTADAFVDE